MTAVDVWLQASDKPHWRQLWCTRRLDHDQVADDRDAHLGLVGALSLLSYRHHPTKLRFLILTPYHSCTNVLADTAEEG